MAGCDGMGWDRWDVDVDVDVDYGLWIMDYGEENRGVFWFGLV